jgi:hypothetical protein
VWAQLTAWLKEQGRRLAHGLGLAALFLGRAAYELWRLFRPSLIFALNVLAALLLLFEEWGWRPLSNLLAKLARFRVWALIELWLAGLPPYGALLALGVPSAILIPAKLFGVYLLALGHVVTAMLVLIAAKIASTALIARIFILTKPALMQIGWFQRAYDAFVPWQEALFAWIRSSWVWRYGRVVKWRAKGYLRRSFAALRPQVRAAWATLRPKAVALLGRLRAGARDLLERASIASRRLLRRLEGQ